MQYRTKSGDVLDAICWRYYGHENAVPQVLAVNPGVADYGPTLPAGVIIELPDIAPETVVTATVKLWD